MLHVGADACRVGWLTVILREGADWKVDIFQNIFELWDQCKDARLILLDVPIGLRESESNERCCDKDARRLLGRKRGPSVFPAPCRPAVYAETYEEASGINERMTGRRLSKQVWGIIPKIRQVDQLLLAQMPSRLRIREIHPEVLFWAFASFTPMRHSKKTREGFSERKGVLLNVYDRTDDIVSYALSKFPRREVSADDILDALAAAVTASVEEQHLSSIPKTAEVDSCGLSMEMVYCVTRSKSTK